MAGRLVPGGVVDETGNCGAHIPGSLRQAHPVAVANQIRLSGAYFSHCPNQLPQSRRCAIVSNAQNAPDDICKRGRRTLSSLPGVRSPLHPQQKGPAPLGFGSVLRNSSIFGVLGSIFRSVIGFAVVTARVRSWGVAGLASLDVRRGSGKRGGEGGTIERTSHRRAVPWLGVSPICPSSRKA